MYNTTLYIQKDKEITQIPMNMVFYGTPALGPQYEWRKGQKIKEESTAKTTKYLMSFQQPNGAW